MFAGVYEDAGDLTFTEKDAFSVIEAEVGALIDAGKRPVSLGGDHSITFPIVKAVGQRHPGLTIFHFDAHPDLYEEFEGNRLSHACPFARIMEAGLAKRLVQIGIRTLKRTPAGAGGKIWRGSGGDARATGLRQTQSNRAGVYHL